MYVPAALLAILAAPLALNLVPPNRIYGIRTQRTLASRVLWFRVNRVAGVAFLAAAGFALAVYRLQPALASGRSLSGVLVLVLPVLAALACTAMYSRKAVGRSD